MDKILLALKSRTVWSVILIVITNTINAYADIIPAREMALITGILGALTAYFRINIKAQ